MPADGDVSEDALCLLINKSDEADLILLYLINREEKGMRRNILSSVFNLIFMLSFGIYVFYTNGPAIYPAALLKNFNLRSNRFSIVSEMTVKTLRSGVTYIEVPGHMKRGLKEAQR